MSNDIHVQAILTSLEPFFQSAESGKLWIYQQDDTGTVAMVFARISARRAIEWQTDHVPRALRSAKFGRRAVSPTSGSYV